MSKAALVILVLVAILGGFFLMQTFFSKVAEPEYTVVSSDGNIEIREYAPMIVAEVTTHGDRKKAINQGFRLLADFIFGNNTAQDNIDMTAPVTQQTGEKISMTAPVSQQSSSKIAMTAPVSQQSAKIDMTAPVSQQTDGDAWTIRFVMPAKYTMDTLPKPNNSAVKIQALSPERFVVIRFSGSASEGSIKQHESLLMDYIANNNLVAQGSPRYAFYNPPWTPPFLRRNEIMVKID